MKRSFFGKNKIVIAAVVCFVAIVYLTSFFRLKYDLTAEKRFTLSTPTLQLLDSVNEPVEIQLFLTGNLPSDYKKLSQATVELLQDFKDRSHNNVHYTLVIPGENLADDSLKAQLYDSLARLGVVFENTEDFSQKDNSQTTHFVIPSALVSVPGKAPIAVDLRSSRPIFKNYDVINDAEAVPDKEATLNAAEALLEYKFANAIDKLTRKRIPSIVYLVGNGEPIDLSVNDIGESLRKEYRLGVADLKTSFPNPNDIDALLIVKPTNAFTEMDKFKLDQYVMHGGKILWFIDRLYASLDSIMRTQANFVAYDRNLQLDDIFFKYGVRINGDLLQDLNCAKLPIIIGYNPDNSPRMQRMPWPYYPFLSSVNNNPISNNLDRVLPQFPSTLDTVAAPGIKKTILLASDSNSRVLTSPAIVSLNSWQDDPTFQSFNRSHLPVAVLLEGKFKSLYANRLTPEMQDSVQQKLNMPFLPQASQPTAQIVVSNAGVVTNAVTKNGPLPMGTVPYDNYKFANKDFLLNSVDYLISNNGLFVARNKDFILRVLDKQKIEAQKSLWQILNIVLPIALIILFGIVFNRVRQKKFGH